jgi:hypothetical protein
LALSQHTKWLPTNRQNTWNLEDPIKSEIAPPAPSLMDSVESVTLDLSDLRGSINKILMADALALKSMCTQMGVKKHNKANISCRTLRTRCL